MSFELVIHLNTNYSVLNSNKTVVILKLVIVSDLNSNKTT